LIREKEEGGMRAARMLNDAVEKYLQQSVPQARNARVIVRIYADLTSLSKNLSKSKVIGFEKRSISPFSAAFTRAISLFDFVDALDEEGTKFKIREQFKMASEDTACSHILYAACADPAYLSQLVPFSGVRDKITLVQGAGWNSEFHQFNLNVTQFPTIFRWSGLSAAAPANKTSTPTAPKPKPPITTVHKGFLTSGPSTPRRESWRRDGSMSVADSAFGDLSPVETNGFGNHEPERVGWESWSAYTQNPKPTQKEAAKGTVQCKYFQKGFCRFGNKCNFQHIPKGLDGTNGVNGYSQASQASPVDRGNIAAALPTAVVPGFIPLNKDGNRLDVHLRAPTTEEWKAYNTRFANSKPCNAFHLLRSCTTFACPYDHDPVDADVKEVLKYVLRGNPCPRKGKCRRSECVLGHVCQKEGRWGQGQGTGGKGCRIKPECHYKEEECKVGSLVPDEEPGLFGEGGGMEQLERPDEGGYMW
jgi:hypothetical protein